ncbi:MAG TPA: hypothetical protein PLL10_07030 [Elusimicrobiales bacterium]|nr:hypothetical protein [Elusimicrobiales bacterium]
MKAISKELIEKVYRQMNSVTDKEAAVIVEEIKKKQPYAFEYLISAGGQHEFNKDERQWLSYIGVILCKIMVEAEPDLPAVPREHIDRCAAKITDLVRYLKGGDKEDFVKVIAGMLKDYPQPHLLNFIVGVIKTAQEEKAGVSAKNASVFFFFFKILMDSFSQEDADSAQN